MNIVHPIDRAKFQNLTPSNTYGLWYLIHKKEWWPSITSNSNGLQHGKMVYILHRATCVISHKEFCNILSWSVNTYSTQLQVTESFPLIMYTAKCLMKSFSVISEEFFCLMPLHLLAIANTAWNCCIQYSWTLDSHSIFPKKLYTFASGIFLQYQHPSLSSASYEIHTK